MPYLRPCPALAIAFLIAVSVVAVGALNAADIAACEQSNTPATCLQALGR